MSLNLSGLTIWFLLRTDILFYYQGPFKIAQVLQEVYIKTRFCCCSALVFLDKYNILHIWHIITGSSKAKPYWFVNVIFFPYIEIRTVKCKAVTHPGGMRESANIWFVIWSYVYANVWWKVDKWSVCVTDYVGFMIGVYQMWCITQTCTPHMNVVHLDLWNVSGFKEVVSK